MLQKELLKKLDYVQRKLKALLEKFILLPNGTISQVVNYSMKNSLAIVDVTIPFEVGVDKAEKLIEQLLSDIAER